MTETTFQTIVSLPKDFIDEMDKMGHTEMEQILFEMSESRTYVAICKYLFSRSRMSHDGLATVNPLKDPETILRNQGIISGLLDLISAIQLIREEKKQEVDNVA